MTDASPSLAIAARPTPGRVLSALIVASVFALVLATRVFVAFDPLRVRLVEAPAADSSGRVRVEGIDARLIGLDPPIALIARIQHGAPQKQQFSIRWNGGELCSVQLAGGAARRVDCVLAGAPLRPGELELTVDGPTPWTLNYLELATHHGNSTGVATAFVLPAASNRYTRPHPAWAVALALTLMAPLLIPQQLPRSRALVLISRALAALAFAVAALVLVAPVFSPYRFVLSPGTFAGAVTLLLLPLAARLVQAIRKPLTERRLTGALAAGVFAFGLISGSRALGAADTYGYVSQAELWLRGNLKIDQSFALRAPWPEPASTFAPLGYRPHPLDETRIVPIYSPGLPMMMALAKWLGGQNAMFAIVPLLGALLVLATYGIGSRLGSASVGLVGAWLIATSPIVLGHVTIAMSDVPVAAVWTAAIYMLLGEGKRSAVTAGLLSGAAILIRPNLAPLAAILALYYVLRIFRGADRRAHRSELVLFCAATLPGIAAVAMIHASLFGSPLSSGYGPLSELFAWSRVGPNVSNYVSWLVEAHTPIVLIGFAAIFFPLRRLWPGVRDRAVFFVCGAFVIVLWAVYCAWLVFDSWWFGRFMLSSVPFATLGIGAVAVALARLPIPFIRPLVVCLVVALGLVQLRFASKNGVFGIPDLERRNVAIARLAAQVTESNSVILSGIHSGSLRYYAGRMTLNFTLLDSAWLDGAVAWLSEHGTHPYLLIEDWERADFERRFAGSRSLAALERSAAGIYENPGEVTIVDLSPRDGRGQTTVVASGTDIGWRAIEPAPPPRLVQSP